MKHENSITNLTIFLTIDFVPIINLISKNNSIL